MRWKLKVEEYYCRIIQKLGRINRNANCLSGVNASGRQQVQVLNVAKHTYGKFIKATYDVN